MSDLYISIESEKGIKLNCRYVRQNGLAPDVLGRRRRRGHEAHILVYEAERSTQDPLGMPLWSYPIGRIHLSLQKNGKLFIPYTKPRNGEPRRYSQRISAANAEKMIAFADSCANSDLRQLLEADRQRRRPDILTRWRRRLSERFVARPHIASRPSALAERHLSY